ncbi:MAG: LysR family transcriptional regulator [Tepidiformaceae bacterium]
MIDLPPHLLRSFVAVADSQSYTHGGATLFLAQPTVHQHVRQLEHLTGAKLVEQVGKRVQLTSQGRLVYDHALGVFEQTETLDRTLADDKSLAAGELALAAATTAGEFLVPSICAGFQRTFPGITVGVSIINDPVSVDQAVADGRVDMGLHSKGNRVAGLVKVPLLEERLVGIAPPGHPLATRETAVAPQDLVDERFVAFRGRVHRARNPSADFIPFTQLVDDWFTAADAWPRCCFAATSHEGIKNAVRLGMGVAIVASVAVRPDDNSLCTFELAEAPRRSFVLVYREAGWRSSAWRAFLDYARSLAWGTSCRAPTVP